MRNVIVSVEVDGKTHTTALTQSTFQLLREEAALRRRSTEFYLQSTVTVYGKLTEETVLELMDANFIL